MHKSKRLKLPELINNFMIYLEEQGYALSTRTRLKSCYIQLLKYGKSHNIQYYNLEIGKTFLLEKYGLKWTIEKLSPRNNNLQRVVVMLAEFQEHSEVITKRRVKRKYFIPHFQQIIDDFLEYKRNQGLRQSSLTSKRHSLNKIFEFLESTGLQDSKNITVSSIYDFLESQSHFSLATKELYQYQLRDIIKYMHKNNLCKPELKKLFPVISVHTKNAYPSHFKPHDISKILDSVNTNSSIGKRDYLILLFAAQLGMRVEDIRCLKKNNIDLKKKTVKYIQLKTGYRVCFPMSNELFYAYIDYIKSARLESNCEEVFTKTRAPEGPFSKGNNFYYVLQKYLKTADINITNGQKHGLHSLRSSLASNMLRNGVSIPVISNVLGHKYYDTTSIYLKIDLEGLRKVALEVPVL